ncbi:hypothetical protein [Campylobacter rectus]|uniref:hypothetical protein n=1 Tax=Campylobacter rectus TaxID=203 RepID=UPI00163ABDA4|nr:hypothetical protein [Campylobacter rectus]
MTDFAYRSKLKQIYVFECKFISEVATKIYPKYQAPKNRFIEVVRIAKASAKF